MRIHLQSFRDIPSADYHLEAQVLPVRWQLVRKDLLNLSIQRIQRWAERSR